MPYGHAGIPAKVLELIEEAVIVTDAEGIVNYMNPFAERLYGWGPGEATGRSVLEVNVPEILREQASQIMETLRAGRSWSGTFLVQRRDGTRFTAAVTNSPLIDEQGRLRAIIGISRDVTESERAAEAVRTSEARFRTIADQSPTGIFETDLEGRYVYLNGVAQNTLGPVASIPEGPRWHDSIHPEDRQRVQREWRRADSTGEVFASEFRLRGPDGRSILAQVRAAALRDRYRRIVGHVGVVVDITRNEALRTQLALASRLAAIGAHVAGVADQVAPLVPGSIPNRVTALEVARLARKRLQTGAPLDPVTELLVVEEVIKALEKAEEGARRITQIVKEMRRIGKTAPGRIQVRLYDVVNQALHWLPEEVSRSAAIEIDRRTDPEITVAAGQIEQVVVNLVTSAVRATARKGGGKVVVRIGSGSPGMATLEVDDPGSGIDLVARDAILQSFFKDDPDGGDAGLGLVVSHVIVAAHGGTLSVSSGKGNVSTVRVELPVAGATVP